MRSIDISLWVWEPCAWCASRGASAESGDRSAARAARLMFEGVAGAAPLRWAATRGAISAPDCVAMHSARWRTMPRRTLRSMASVREVVVRAAAGWGVVEPGRWVVCVRPVGLAGRGQPQGAQSRAACSHLGAVSELYSAESGLGVWMPRIQLQELKFRCVCVHMMCTGATDALTRSL